MYRYMHFFSHIILDILLIEKRLWPNPPRFVDTIADGIRFQQVGHLTFPIMCEKVEEKVFTVVSERCMIYERVKYHVFLHDYLYHLDNFTYF